MTPSSRWALSPRHQEASGSAETFAGRAATLRALHRPGDPLVLPNVWDAASARAVEAAGFPAVATSSAAVAESLGYADGEATPLDQMLDAVARIASAVSVPVTADLERGYGSAPDELVERLAAAGIAGCNMEDSDPRTNILINAKQQADFLSALRDAARRAGLDLVINARIDTYLNGAGTDAEKLAEAVRRAHLYLAAGADCAYPILAAEPQAIRVLTQQSGGPINILFTSKTPSLTDLAGLGVARISFGTDLHRAMQQHFARMLARIKALGNPHA